MIIITNSIKNTFMKFVTHNDKKINSAGTSGKGSIFVKFTTLVSKLGQPDLGSGDNKVIKMYDFNKREINKKQRRELPRMESVEDLNTALLYMKYDMKKKLTENKNNLKK